MSLAQRQVVDLRNKLSQQDFKLKRLSVYALENQQISRCLQWCVYMLAEEKRLLCLSCALSLAHCFEGLDVALKLWPCPEYIPVRFGGVSNGLKTNSGDVSTLLDTIILKK